jgi:hypothetical protein
MVGGEAGVDSNCWDIETHEIVLQWETFSLKIKLKQNM